MISDEMAQRQAVGFLDSKNLPELSKMVAEGACLSKIFPKAVKSLGKKRVLVLYRKLSSELREYFLIYFLSGSEKFNDRLRRLDAKYGVAGDPEYFQKIEKLLVRYLEE